MRALIMSPGTFELTLIEEYEINGSRRFKFRELRTGIIINVSGKDVEDARERASQVASLVIGNEGGSVANDTDYS
ncbi:MAG: hypothetical protein QXP23_02545 [Fervidicoccaceae archaeon]